jgi:glycerol-3-phosphate O-acyltransferase
VAEGRRELSLLVEILDVARTQEKPVHLVPLALFWRKGPPVRRFGKLTMGSASRPSDLAKVSSFLLTYRDLAIKVGEPIELSAFAAKQPDLAGEPLARRLRRSILLFLAGEERVAEGPRLRPRHRVQDSVLRDPRVAAAIAARALEEGTPEAARASAEKMFREIAANMNPSFLATLAATVNAIFRRLFAAIVPVGLERVAAIARTTPVVLVPSHRSYFDFLVMSWLFYDNRLMPPHIAARENMAFGPFGYVFRRVGAFFLRRAFDDDLYKAVFRSYVGYLVREGFTQEFFIEGARSRTGKSLAPRMGILSWNVRGFIDSGRRDLFFVPVGISYERLVEEGAMVDELEGGEKQGESMLGLVRARKVLRRRFGSVFLNFGEPISLAQALQGHRAAFEAGAEEDPAAQEERRAVVEGLGHEIVERINWAMVANATSVAACALLAEPRRGMFRHELAQHMRRIVDLLVLQDVRLTPALSADAPAYDESIDFLLRSGLVKSEVDERGEILFYEESKRRALDVYRNVLVHFLVVPSLIARRALRGASRVELREDVAYWLELLYREFYVPRALVQAAHVDAFIDDFVRTGALEDRDGVLHSSEAGRPDLVFIAGQTAALFEAYATACAALARLDGTTPLRTLEK